MLSSRLARRLAMAAACSGAVAFTAVAQPQAKPATLHVLRTAGAAATLTDSLGGGAIVTAANMGAGNSVTGDVRIAFDGDATAAVALTTSGVTDTPGPGGGRLSDVLLVAVDDLTTGQPVYAGPLATMPEVQAGRLSPGDAHDYRFTVTLPRSAGDGFQSSTAELAYVWTATDAPPDPVTPSVTPPTDVTPPQMAVTTKPAQRLDHLALGIRCDEACLLAATARVTDVKDVTPPRVTVSYEARGATLRFAFTKSALTKLIRKGRATLLVTITAVDAAGNRSVSTQRVTLTFSRAPKHVMHPVRVGVVQVRVR
jgi:hypothetical protein